MSVLEFIASVASSLAWPAAVLLAAFLLRHRIRDLVDRLLKVKVAGVELELETRRLRDDVLADRSEGPTQTPAVEGSEQGESPSLDDASPGPGRAAAAPITQRSGSAPADRATEAGALVSALRHLALHNDPHTSADPLSVVLESWSRVERAVYVRATHVWGPDPLPTRNALALTDMLVDVHSVDDALRKQIGTLWKLRNEAAHLGRRVSWEVAQNFAEAADGVCRDLSGQ